MTINEFIFQIVMFSGKVALITGASSGIGRDTARRFAAEGAYIVINGRDRAALESLKEEFPNNCFSLIAEGDVTKEDVCKRVMDEAIKTFGKLDILVNSAGVMVTGPMETTSIESYDKVMDVNVRGMILITQLAIPHLKKTKGNIVNVSSVCGPRAFPGISFYCMSKAATDSFTQCLALELAPDGVRVNAVNPGVIITNVHKRAGMSDEQYAGFLERAKQTHPIGRPGNVDEVSSVIAFLASDQASFMTGNLTPVDGGRAAACPR